MRGRLSIANSRNLTALAAVLLVAVPVSAHHSDAGMDMESTVTIEGTIKEVAWQNPHTFLVVESVQSGEPVDWELQMGPVHVQVRRGWSADSVSVGDEVTIRANVFANGRPYGLLRSLVSEDFSVIDGIPTGQFPQGEIPPAESLAGIWRMNLQKTKLYSGGLRRFLRCPANAKRQRTGSPGRLRSSVRRESRIDMCRAANALNARLHEYIHDGDRSFSTGGDHHHSG